MFQSSLELHTHISLVIQRYFLNISLLILIDRLNLYLQLIKYKIMIKLNRIIIAIINYFNRNR